MTQSKNATITIRTTEEEKEQIERIASADRRTLGGLLYIWTIDRLKQEQEKATR